MENITFVLPEIFLSLSIMFLLIFGVFKEKSSTLIYLLSIIVLLITIGLIFNLPGDQEINLFKNSYKIDKLSIFMKVVTLLSGFFVLLCSFELFVFSNIDLALENSSSVIAPSL